MTLRCQSSRQTSTISIFSPQSRYTKRSSTKDAYLKKIGKERDVETENEQENEQELNYGELTERQRIICDAIKTNGNVTAKTLAVTLAVSARTIERELNFLRKEGYSLLCIFLLHSQSLCPHLSVLNNSTCFGRFLNRDI